MTAPDGDAVLPGAPDSPRARAYVRPGARGTKLAHVPAAELADHDADRTELQTAYNGLRTALARLRRARDPKARATARALTAATVETLGALTERAREADPRPPRKVRLRQEGNALIEKANAARARRGMGPLDAD
ncbi:MULTISPECIES: hypothetical protein [Pseudonocardia]|uniref:Uncharacterized protein n=1 Tax=Pseudonocardia autotrophica TaxID=2074 RepID=A0A1Y2N0R5_PSEAH|nr:MULTISPECIES: hypothetical protein [Pseudonocardia]OSY41025.1 hypothetical protein BG845_02367 [Pseudonocardia autotrophica]TDN73848.1 hypothetical protein C8E95_2955 [Pseudonocardia autotrophica]